MKYYVATIHESEEIHLIHPEDFIKWSDQMRNLAFVGKYDTRREAVKKFEERKKLNPDYVAFNRLSFWSRFDWLTWKFAEKAFLTMIWAAALICIGIFIGRLLFLRPIPPVERKIDLTIERVVAQRKYDRHVRDFSRAARKKDFIEMSRLRDSIRYYEVKIDVIKKLDR